MLYRQFGRTKLNLSVFSLGTMRCLASGENMSKTVTAAINLGINHLETARGYGKSEEYLGLTLQNSLPLAREKIYITTKLSPTPDRQLMAQWINESLERLRLDYIDCLAIHGINTWEHLNWVKQPDGCMRAIQTAIAAGKIRHVGFSTHGSLELILAAIETDLFDFVNLHYYYFFQRNQAAISRANQQNMGVLIISPADKGGKLYNPPKLLQKLTRPLTPLEFNYRFLLSDHRITTLSLGAANPQELLPSLAVAEQTEPLNPTETAIINRLKQRLKATLSTEQCNQCYKCLPCPENINIPEILRLRNLAVGLQMEDYGKYRYQMLENAGHWFPGKKGNRCTQCGDCLPRCPEQLAIPDLLQDTHQRLNGRGRKRLWSL